MCCCEPMRKGLIRCGVRCFRCGRPQYDTTVYIWGDEVLCRSCWLIVAEEASRRG